MAINFPASLDTLTNPAGTNKLNSPDHAQQHADANDAIEALEAKVGANSSAVTTSHDYKLSGVTGSDKAVSLTGTETLTNKTLTSPSFLGTLDGWVSANETWTYASADDPTFTFTVTGDLTGKYSAGMRIKLTQTTVKYFIITVVAHAGGTTTITVYGGTDYDLANATITSPYYSTQKAPQGFPLSPIKWTVETTDTMNRNQVSPVADTWYNLGTTNSQIIIPIGVWDVEYLVDVHAIRTSTTANVALQLLTTLSTTNNTQTDAQWTTYGLSTHYISAAVSEFAYHACRRKVISLATKTTYYLNAKTPQANYDLLEINSNTPMIIRALCAYL